jgi:signal transduction histidine kinase
MVKLRLRTKFLLSLLLVTASVTCGTLWMVGKSVGVQLRKEIAGSLNNSLIVFQDFRRQREMSLASSAELLASLPSLKALMTTRDAVTIQDASTDIWRLAPSDLFVLADPTGHVMALHTRIPGLTRSAAEKLLRNSLTSDQASIWWYGNGHLYQLFLRPIYFGSPANQSALGVLGVGHEISETLAVEIGRIASSDVAFFYGDKLIVSTLHNGREVDLVSAIPYPSDITASSPAEIRLGGETFLATTVQLEPRIPPFVRLSVLKSYDTAALFLGDLRRILLGLGVLAVLAGSAVVFFISYTFTKPLANLVAGLRAVQAGDFTYSLSPRSGDEIGELTSAFVEMRTSLLRTQRGLLAAERLATIGLTASSISHDLRHPLTAVVANAEFLCDQDLDSSQREELYREIRTAVDQITNLVDSLLEFSQAKESLHRVFGSVEETVQRAVYTLKAHPEFHGANVPIFRNGRCETWFDQRKVERALLNVLRNACQATQPSCGQVEVNLSEKENCVEIRVVDHGPGIAKPIQDKLFRPFVSYGKQNGTGLGLAIGQKIFQDHGGDACLESTEPGRTVFKFSLPIHVPVMELLPLESIPKGV